MSGYIVIVLWLTLVNLVFPHLQFTSLSSYLNFIAYSYLVVFCSYYLSFLLLFKDRASRKKPKYFYEYLLESERHRLSILPSTSK